MPARKTTIVARLILEQRGKLLFLAQTTKNGGKYSLVGGKVDSEEMATEALVRETMEETSVIIQQENLRLVHVLQRQRNNETMIVLYFTANEWLGEARNCEPKKFKGVFWFATDDLPKNLSRITKRVLINYRKGLFFTEYDERKELILN